MSIAFKNIVDLVLHRASTQAAAKAFYFLENKAVEAQHISNADLLGKASQIARYFQEHHLAGERALLLYPQGLEYICGFLGCLLGEVIAVPVSSPLTLRAHNKLYDILRNCQAKLILTSSNVLNDKRSKTFLQRVQSNRQVKVIATDTLFNFDYHTAWDIPALSGDAIAFLQFTSGSTSFPKGVMVSHDNILHNSECIHRQFSTSPDSFCVSWLPLYHDMGLIGTMFQPLYKGFPGFFMSPLHFLHKPWKWLQIISDYEADLSGGPNFAYDYCVQKINPEVHPDLDLSSWRVSFNGGEPLQAKTMKRFAAKFSGLGFKLTSFAPCYGMAENTLIISGCSDSEEPTTISVDINAYKNGDIVLSPVDESSFVQELCSSGRPAWGQEVLILDPETKALCLEQRIGEIWVSGESCTKGYWNDQVSTEKVYTKWNPSVPKTYLRTQDLGFLYKGELFVTGRLKELIIIRGQNYYPHDIERIAQQAHPVLRSNAGAAFVREETPFPELILVQEVNRNTPVNELGTISQKIKFLVFEYFGLRLNQVVFVNPFSIPKTSSGKIQRLQCKKQFNLDQLNLYHLHEKYAR